MLSSADLDIPIEVILEETTSMASGFTSYKFRHVDGRCISVVVADEYNENPYDVSTFVRIWAEN